MFINTAILVPVILTGFFFNYRESKDFEIDPNLNITEMSGGLRVHWQNQKEYYKNSLENNEEKEIINLKAHSSGKMQQVIFTNNFFRPSLHRNFNAPKSNQ